MKKGRPGYIDGSNFSYLEEIAERWIKDDRLCLPEPVRQHRFQRWVFDLAYPKLLIAIDIQGGTYGKGPGHSDGAQYKRDCLKLNAAQVSGWIVLWADRELVTEYNFWLTVKKAVNRRLFQLKQKKAGIHHV